MSALTQATPNGPITDAILEAVRPMFAQAIWTWYDANRDRVLFAKRLLIFSFKITVSDLEPLVVEIAGPRPT